MIIRAKTFKKWMTANFERGELRDIANHGADAGWGGLTYTRDLRDLYAKFKDEMWERLADEAESYGDSGVLAMLAQTQRGKSISTASDIEELVVWFVSELYAQEITGW